MTSVSTPTGTRREQRTHKLGFRLWAALLTVATGVAIAFAITYTRADTPSVVAPASTAVHPADIGILSHAARYGTPQPGSTVDGTSRAMNNLAATQAAMTTGESYAVYAEAMKGLSPGGVAQHGAVNPADIGILNLAARYGTPQQASTAVNPADIGILNLAARYGGPTAE